MGKLVDLTGQKFGKLTVLERVEDHITSGGNRFTQWKCICDCQQCLSDDEKQYYIAYGNKLRNYKTISCGCSTKEIIGVHTKQRHKKNRSTYDLSGEYGIGHTYDGYDFYFDLDDYEKIKDFNWHINDQGYVLARIKKDEKFTEIRMHRIILGVNNKNDEVDHIHGKNSRRDNRKGNLRVVTHSQNNINKGIRANNTSGVTGVDYVKRLNKWRARISLDNRNMVIGLFDDKNDAIIARENAEEKYFGEYSYKNSMEDLNEQNK